MHLKQSAIAPISIQVFNQVPSHRSVCTFISVVAPISMHLNQVPLHQLVCTLAKYSAPISINLNRTIATISVYFNQLHCNDLYNCTNRVIAPISVYFNQVPLHWSICTFISTNAPISVYLNRYQCTNQRVLKSVPMYQSVYSYCCFVVLSPVCTRLCLGFFYGKSKMLSLEMCIW